MKLEQMEKKYSLMVREYLKDLNALEEALRSQPYYGQKLASIANGLAVQEGRLRLLSSLLGRNFVADVKEGVKA